jgi:hypothetical protein
MFLSLRDSSSQEWQTLLEVKSHLHEILSFGQSILYFYPSFQLPDDNFHFQLQEVIQSSSELLHNIMNHSPIPPEVGEIAYFSTYFPFFAARTAFFPRILSLLKFRYFQVPLGNFNGIVQKLHEIVDSDFDRKDIRALEKPPCDFQFPDELLENLRKTLPKPFRIPQKLKDEVDKFRALANFHAFVRNLNDIVGDLGIGWEILEKRIKIRIEDGLVISEFYKECYRASIKQLEEVSFRLSEGNRERSEMKENEVLQQKLKDLQTRRAKG